MNNGCGDVKIIRERQNLTIEEIREHFSKYFKTTYGNQTGEPHYTQIRPCLFAETYLDANQQSVKSSSLIDYKFWCFDGYPYCCFVCSNRTKHHFTIDLYTANEDWTRIDDHLIFNEHHLKGINPIPRPKNLERMLEMASKLSKGFPQMRVDLYEVGGRVYFGELTMTSMGGRMNYFSKEILQKMGSLCKDAYFRLINI